MRNPHVVISRQSPFAANAVPKSVAMATSLRPSISAIKNQIKIYLLRKHQIQILRAVTAANDQGQQGSEEHLQSP